MKKIIIGLILFVASVSNAQGNKDQEFEIVVTEYSVINYLFKYSADMDGDGVREESTVQVAEMIKAEGDEEKEYRVYFSSEELGDIKITFEDNSLLEKTLVTLIESYKRRDDVSVINYKSTLDSTGAQSSNEGVVLAVIELYNQSLIASLDYISTAMISKVWSESIDEDISKLNEIQLKSSDIFNDEQIKDLNSFVLIPEVSRGMYSSGPELSSLLKDGEYENKFSNISPFFNSETKLFDTLSNTVGSQTMELFLNETDPSYFEDFFSLPLDQSSCKSWAKNPSACPDSTLKRIRNLFNGDMLDGNMLDILKRFNRTNSCKNLNTNCH